MPMLTHRVKFLIAWALLVLAKLILAAHLDLFGDEAFYAWEGRHPAGAYSDLPAGTAWLAALGQWFALGEPWALRLPFMALGAASPWLVVATARLWFGSDAGWRAGLWSMSMPIMATLGLLALPDVPLTFATLLCMYAVARLLERPVAIGYVLLAAALVIGALSHYRFVVVIGAGLIGLLLQPEGRRLLVRPATWATLAAGAMAWLPLLHWNLSHRGAGIGFQLVERHPWAFHLDGLAYPLVQAATVTPLLAALLCWALWQAWLRWRRSEPGPWGLVLGAAGVPLLGYFVLGFFADNERVNFHWPLPAWLALCTVLPVLLDRATAATRRFAAGAGALAVSGVLAVYVLAGWAAVPSLRAGLAEGPVYPQNFAGWRELASASAEALGAMPADTRLVADNFMPAAALAFHLARRDIEVLDHAPNHKHGRAAQLAIWGRVVHDLRDRSQPVLLVVDAYSVKPRQWLAWRQALCAVAGPLPAPRTVLVDGGARRFWLFELPPGRSPEGPCVAPALAWIDAPAPGERIAGDVLVHGWAMKEGVGVARVEVVVGDRVLAEAELGHLREDLRDFWGDIGDPGSPRLGFRALIDADRLPRGRQRIALRLTGGDGSVETLAEQWVEVAPR